MYYNNHNIIIFYKEYTNTKLSNLLFKIYMATKVETCVETSSSVVY